MMGLFDRFHSQLIWQMTSIFNLYTIIIDSGTDSGSSQSGTQTGDNTQGGGTDNTGGDNQGGGNSSITPGEGD